LSEHGLGGAPFPVALERNPGQRAGQKSEVVEGRPAPRAQRAVTADTVESRFRFGLDILDDLGLESPARLEYPAVGVGIVRHRSKGLLPEFPFPLVKVP